MIEVFMEKGLEDKGGKGKILSFKIFQAGNGVAN